MAEKNLSHTNTRVAIYVRVSTTNHGQDTEVQACELREYATRRGWQVVQEYADHVSGAKEKRPALDQLMRDARRRKFDTVLCWKLDRIGRSLKHLVNLLAELEACAVALVSLSDSLDLSTPPRPSDVPDHRGDGRIRAWPDSRTCQGRHA